MYTQKRRMVTNHKPSMKAHEPILNMYWPPKGLYKRAENGVSIVRMQPRAFRRGRAGIVKGKYTPAIREKLLTR